MDLYYIDYVSVSNESWLHRVPAWAKLVGLLVIIGVLLSLEYVPAIAVIAVGVVVLALTARIPMKLYLPLMLYPILFLVVLFLSIDRLTLAATLFLGARVLAITGTVLLVFFTTSFPAIFGTLGRVLPSFMVAALFYTYRSIFVLSDSIENLRVALHVRGGIDSRHPIQSVRHFGMALGHFLVHSIEQAQRMADGLTTRGFANKIYFLDGEE